MKDQKKIVYFDCVSGISGDMALAALIDLGADSTYIEQHLRRLPIELFEMSVLSVIKQGIVAKKLHLHFGHARHHHDHHHRRASDILDMIENSDLPPRVKERSHAIFQAIAVAEGKIHGIDPRDVHFHEVGAMDSIIDTIGVCLALEFLNIDEIHASPVPTGHGKVSMAHGFYPIPAPATTELLRGIPLAALDVQGELTTPTGAGILKALASQFYSLGFVTINQIGYGAGEKDFSHPNVLRALLIEKNDSNSFIAGTLDRERVVILEAQVDDMLGEALGYLMERLLVSGALDVYYTPVYMKKNRPGTLITVLSREQSAYFLEELLLTETTTLGVRRSIWTRRILDRKTITVETSYGPIRIKQAYRGTVILHQAPEYEDVATLARTKGIPFLEVYNAALLYKE